jgi:hypothetical protein
MHFHRSAFVLPVVVVLLVGCTSEANVNLGDPEKEAAAVKESPVSVKPAPTKSVRGKPPKQPGVQLRSSQGTQPVDK